MTFLNPGRPRKYTFAEMATGDTQFFPLTSGTIRDLQNRLKTSAQKYGQFTTGRGTHKGAHGVRVTRA